jgi:hypothetical protein
VLFFPQKFGFLRKIIRQKSTFAHTITDFLEIIYRPILLFANGVSETGHCLRPQEVPSQFF